MKLVQPHELADAWPQVEWWIKRAISYGQGDENALDVLIKLARGHYFLWHEPGRFACVVEVQHHPRQRVCAVIYLGGSDLGRIKSAIHGQLFPWAKACGCLKVRCCGRRGWHRLFAMKHIGTSLQLELSQETT